MGRRLAGTAVIAALAAAAPAAASTTWTRLPISDPGCRSDISALEYQGPDRLWFTTINGEICRVVGGTATNRLSAPGVAFRDIEFQAGGTIGLAVGGGALYRSTDGGQTWSPVAVGSLSGPFDCVSAAPLAEAEHVRFASAGVAFLFGDRRQIAISDATPATVGQAWSNWNRYDPAGTPGNPNDDACRYGGEVEDAFFYTAAPPAGYFTGTDGTRLLRSLANATTTSSGLESARAVRACDGDGGCVLTGDPASPARQQALDEPFGLYGTEDAWGTFHQATYPNRGGRPFPELADLDSAGGTVVAAGAAGAIVVSRDGARTAYFTDPPADATGVRLRAVGVADARNAAVGGDGGTLLLTTNADDPVPPAPPAPPALPQLPPAPAPSTDPPPAAVKPSIRPNRLRARVVRIRGRRTVVLSATGRLVLPAGTAADACGGRVTLRASRGRGRLGSATRGVTRSCTFAVTVRFARSRLRGRRIGVRLSSAATARLLPATLARTVTLPRR